MQMPLPGDGENLRFNIDQFWRYDYLSVTNENISRILNISKEFSSPHTQQKKHHEEILVLFDDQYATAPTFYNPRPKNSESVTEWCNCCWNIRAIVRVLLLSMTGI